MPLILALLVLLASPLAAQTEIPKLLLPEVAVGQPATGPTAGGDPMAIASDGTNFLITSSVIVKLLTDTHYAMLVDANARPLLDASLQFESKGAPGVGVAASGHEYLVVVPSDGGAADGYRVDSGGKLLDTAPIAIHPPGAFTGNSRATVLWDGVQFVVITASGSPPALVATRVSEAGDVLQTDIPVLPNGVYSVSAAAGHGVTVFVWSDAALACHMRSMNSAGVLGPVTDLPRGATIASGPDGFMILTVANTSAWLQHLSPAGTPDGAAVELPPSVAAPIWLLSTGTSYLLVFGNQMVHVDSAGEFVDNPKTIPPGVPANATFVANDTSAIAAWSIPDTGPGPAGYAADITLARRLDSDAAPVQVQRGYFDQLNPQVSWRANQPLVTWTENGVIEKEVGAGDSTLVGSAGDRSVAVASGPSSTLHVFERGGSYFPYKLPLLYAAIPGGPAVLFDPSPVDIDRPIARAVWTGQDFVVVWKRANTTQIAGARIDVGGNILDGPDVIGDATSLADMAIGASKSEVLVVWQDNGTAHGVLLTAAGELPTDPITTPQDLQFQATSFSVASDGNNFLVTWINKSHTSNPSDDWIGGRLFDANGHGITALTDFSPGHDTKTIASAFWAASEYLVLWSTSSNAVSAFRVTPDGKLIDYPPLAIGTVGGTVTSIARGSSGQIVIAYTRAAIRGGPLRAYTRFIVSSRQRSVRH